MPPFVIPLLSVLFGLVLLTLGAEGLVDGSLRLARRLRVSPLVAGLTIVAFGTSCPELGVSLSAALKGVSDVAIGNVLGSNIANAFLIVGIGALIRPFNTHTALIRTEIPFLFLITLASWALGAFGSLSWPMGIVGVMTFVFYICFLYKARKNPAYGAMAEEDQGVIAGKGGLMSMVLEVILVIGGLGALVLGSNIFLKGALGLGRLIGVPELFIGLTFTAIGTSLPEIAATVSAARRGQGDVIMGNVIGSNLANLCLVLGPTTFFSSIPVSRIVLLRDFPMLLISTMLLMCLVIRRGPVNRILGALLLIVYFSYLVLIRSG